MEYNVQLLKENRNSQFILKIIGLEIYVFIETTWKQTWGEGAGVVVDGGGVVQKPRQILKYTINIYTNQ
jgi:hypothetical protein